MTDEITREMFQHSTVVIAGLNDRITALEAENERLREAMRDAITEIETGAPLTGNDILSAALGEKQ